jgi:DNA ligase (NAD+)
MDINSLGEKTISQLFEMGLVKSPADLYDLKKSDLLHLEGFRDKSAENVLQGIESSKKTPFEGVLFGLGIRHVGKTVAEKLARHFGSMDEIITAEKTQLLETPDIGEKIAVTLYDYLRNPENLREINRLKAAGLRFRTEKSETVRESNKLGGKSFVVSGVFSNFERDEITTVIESNGGKVLSGVSGKTDFLVAGDQMGPAKKEKALKLGVKIISEDEFISMLKNGIDGN